MRFLANMMAIVLLFGCLLVPDIEAKADNLYIALSDTTVKIGDTITVSVTVPEQNFTGWAAYMQEVRQSF